MNNMEMMATIKTELWNLSYSSWIKSELFSFTWWFSVIFLIIGYIIWWKLLDKSRLIELLLFGALAAVMSAIIDTVADNLVLWQYTVRIFPFMPAFFPYHLTLAPIVLIIVYQYTDNWYKYLIGTVFAATIYSFAIIPLFVAIGEVRLLNWNYGFNFLTFIARAIVARWILLLCQQIQCSHEGQPELSPRFKPILQPVRKPLPDTKADEEGGADK